LPNRPLQTGVLPKEGRIDRARHLGYLAKLSSLDR
jgi:hypothetical protein